MDRNEALGIVRKNWPVGNPQFSKALETIIPELKENEDARIRNAIKEAVEHYWSDDTQARTSILSWLEKQTEQKPAWSEEDERKFSDILALLRGGENCHYNTPELFAWLKSIKDRVQPQSKQEWSRQSIIDALTKWLTEKLVPLNKKSLDGTVTEREDMFRAALLEMRSLVNSSDFQIGKDTSTEWSEEDVRNIQNIDSILFYDRCLAEDVRASLRNWLKSLKDKVQPKPEWSEEDEKKIMWLVRLISTAGFRELANDKMPCSRSELIDWLKSLTPQNTWKPSDEMLEALYRVTPENVMEKSEDEMLLDKL